MTQLDSVLQDQLLRLLDGAPRGMTVERLRSLLQAGGSLAGKTDIVRGLRALSERNLVQIGAARRWHIRRYASRGAGDGVSAPGTSTSGEWISAIPCSALLGEPVGPDKELSKGQVTASFDLLTRLLPYYQDALRAGDGGSPFAVLERHGDSFVFLQPDAPWWPTSGHGRALKMPRSRLPGEFQSLLAKNHGKRLFLGYPVHAVQPRSEDKQTFVRPVATFRCRFNLSQSHLEVLVPAMPPAIVREWLRDQRNYGGWDTTRLKSWLLLEDEQGDLQDDDVSPSEFVEIPSFATRMAAAAGRHQHQPLEPSAIGGRVPSRMETGYYNALMLMSDMAGKYTRSAIKDYDKLQSAERESFGETALDAIFATGGGPSSPPPIIHPFPLAESQLLAARAGLSGPLTVITGPPGTGKSQVIAAMMLSAAAAGKSVLFAARQHRALDAVQERLHAFTGDRTLMVRANEAEGFGSVSFRDALRGLQTRAGDPSSARALELISREIEKLDSRRWKTLDQWRELRRVTNKSAELLSQIEDATHKLNEAEEPVSRRIWPCHSGRRSIWRWLRELRELVSRAFTGRRWDIVFGEAWLRNQAKNELHRLRSALSAEEARISQLRAALDNESEHAVKLSDRIASASERVIEPLLDRLDAVGPEDRQSLIAIAGDSALRGTESLTPDAYRIILKHLPLWAVTTLAAGNRIPIEPGLFDYVIFDEAAQTDIASAIPLLYRARTAVIVGDPMQLAMISDVDPKEERDLLQRHNLLREGVGRFAQGRTSLFDLVSSCPNAQRFMLTEHYRCHPQIAAYFNEAFYGRRLDALTDLTRLRVPRGFRAGLHWTDVSGPIVARTGGRSGSASSDAEAKAVVEHLSALIEQGFEGTIGVVTFFEYQARTINEMASRAIGAEKLDRHAVKVFTANKFQGDERDIMLLSLCLGPSMPSGARNFIQNERRLVNVAVSRARAVCHVFGNLEYAQRCGIPHVETLAKKARARTDETTAQEGDRFDSPWEKRLYDALVERGLSPIPQHPVGGRFLDLALIDDDRKHSKRIDVEVDGVTFHTDHDGNRLATDLWRDHQLSGLGWTVLRFWVYELRDDMEKCVERIEAEYRG